MPDWRKQAKEVTDPEIIKKYQRPPFNPPSQTMPLGSPEAGAQVLETLGETAVDMAVTLPEALTVPGASKGLEKIAPSIGTPYREAVERARKRSPIATTIQDFASPSLLNKAVRGLGIAKGLSKAGSPVSKGVGSFVEGRAQDVAQSLGSQIVNEGDISAGRTATDVGVGALLGLTGSFISGKSHIDKYSAGRLRANQLGVRESAFDGFRRINKNKLPTENFADVSSQFEKMGLYAKGRNGGFNFDRGEFMPDSSNLFTSASEKLSSKTMGIATNADNRTILHRVKDAKDKISTRMNEVLKRNSPPLPKATGGNTPPPIPSPQHVRADDFRNSPEIKKWLGQHKGRGENERDVILDKTIEMIWGDNPNALVTLEELNHFKKQMYASLSSQWAQTNLQPEFKNAQMQLSGILADTIKNKIGTRSDRELWEKANRFYERFAPMDMILDKTVQSDFVRGGFMPKFYGGMGYQVQENVMGAAGKTIPGMRAQLGQSFREGGSFSPDFRGMTEGFRTKVAPTTRGVMDEVPEQDNSWYAPPPGGDAQSYRRPPGGRNPQSIFPESMMRENLQNVRIPRTIDGFMENKETFISKVASMNPEMLPVAMKLIQLPAMELEDKLPEVISLVPEIFEPDKYNRANGYFLDPAEQIRADKDIRFDDNLTPTQKAKLRSQMNKTGKLEGY